MSIAENEWLTKSLNSVGELKSWIQFHAKGLMTLVDHDTDTFGKRYDLNLSNYHNVVDYRELMARDHDVERMHKELVRNILDRADRRTGIFETIA